jgi:hypothetical protein
LVSTLRSRTATSAVQAAWTTGASSSGTTNIVRRIPSIRSSVRSSYIARSTAATDGSASLAAADRCTEAGSVACSATTDRVSATGSPARADGASRCRRPSRARRSSTPIVRTFRTSLIG